MPIVAIVRPGCTDFDEQNRIQGVLDLPLNERGRGQLAETVDSLTDWPLGSVYASTSDPARSTAEMISEKLGLDLNITDDLQNVNQGLWQGLPVEEVRRMSPRVLKQWQEAPETIRPPEGETVIRNLLKNLEDYIHADDDIDLLIKLAIMHYQFEAIHPFFDGNGRTGRVINMLFMVENGLLDTPILYLSKYIIEHKNAYYANLRAVTENSAWETWILFILKGIEETASYTLEKINSINRLMHETIVFAKEQLPARVYSKELIELLFEQPYCKVKYLVDKGIAKRQTAAEYLNELEAIGILKSQKVGVENLYLNVKLFELLKQ